MPEKYDISGEIDMIVKNVPYNLEPIEIVRWIYLKLGSIFSYNLKILTEYEKSIEPLNYKQNPNIPISRYQTCIQISEIFSTIINNLNIPNLSAKIIPLKLENKAYAQDHKAVELVYGEEPVMYLYDTKTGLIKTDKEKLISMLNSNWKTNSKTLVKQLNNNGKTL